MTGGAAGGVTLTAIDCGAAVLPKLSPALIVIVSEAVEASVSVKVARSLFTCESGPMIARYVVPAPETPVPAADNSPFVSASVTTKVSPLVTGDPERLTPVIASGCPAPIAAEAGAVIDSVPDGGNTVPVNRQRFVRS